MRGVKCYPGGKKCVLRGKFEFPLREEVDELEGVKKPARKKAKRKKAS